MNGLERDSDFMVGTPFVAGGREADREAPGAGVDCYGLILAMAELRGLPLCDEAACERDAWFHDPDETAGRAAIGWVLVDGPPRVDDILVCVSDRGTPTHFAWVDEPGIAIQATRHGVVRCEISFLRVVRIYRHGNRIAAA